MEVIFNQSIAGIDTYIKGRQYRLSPELAKQYISKGICRPAVDTAKRETTARDTTVTEKRVVTPPSPPKAKSRSRKR